MEEGKKVIVDNPVSVAGVTLIPVANVSLHCYRVGGGILCSGLKQPASVVVAYQSTKRAFRVTGEEVSLDQLTQEVPRLKEVLESHRVSSSRR